MAVTPLSSGEPGLEARVVRGHARRTGVLVATHGLDTADVEHEAAADLDETGNHSLSTSIEKMLDRRRTCGCDIHGAIVLCRVRPWRLAERAPRIAEPPSTFFYLVLSRFRKHDMDQRRGESHGRVRWGHIRPDNNLPLSEGRPLVHGLILLRGQFATESCCPAPRHIQKPFMVRYG